MFVANLLFFFQLWCLIASIFLVLVETKPREVVTESFYERQFSSPAPLPLPSTAPDSTGLKEVVLFLTPEQVQTLQAAGALVRPFPELLTGYPKIQDQSPRNINLNLKIQNVSVVPTDAPTPKKSNPGLDSYYMLFNIQEINDDLALLPQTVEVKPKVQTTTPRYKYTKTRNRNKDKENYATSSGKKSNRTKTVIQNSNSEYVRFLPNYEKNNDLKMLPYNALPIIPYHGDSNPTKAFIQSNSRGRTNGRNSAQSISTERSSTLKPSIISTQTAKNEVTKSIPLVKATAPPLLLRTPVAPQRSSSSRPNEFKETLTSLDKLPPSKKQQIKIETSVQAPVPVPKIRPNEDQLSRLLAPLYQHQVITEAISEQNEKLLIEEGIVKAKLPTSSEYHISTETTSQQKEKILSDEGKVETKPPPPPRYQYQVRPDATSKQDEKSFRQEGKAKIKPPPWYQVSTETIFQQKEKLLSEEVTATIKPQQITEAPQTQLDDVKPTTEGVKLTTYLGKTNALSEVEDVTLPAVDFIKIPKSEVSRNPKNQDISYAVREEIPNPAFSIPSSVLVRSEPFDLPSLYPVTLDITRAVEPQVSRPLSLDITRAIPIPVSKPFRVEMKDVLPIPVEQRVPPVIGNVFLKEQTPILMTQAIPVALRQNVPETIPIPVLEKQIIIRPIWDH